MRYKHSFLKNSIAQIVIALIFFTFASPEVFSAIGQNIEPEAIKLEEGFSIEPAVTNLSVPTTAIFDGQDLIVAESGFKNTAFPRVLRINPKGQIKVLAEAGLEPPVTGLLLIGDRLYISHRGKVSIIQTDGSLKDIVTGLSSKGDHQNNKLVFSKEGKIYLAQGTTTNSGVVGIDNHVFGWLEEFPQAHDVPCKDITLSGENFESENPLKSGQKTLTGAYKPYGKSSKKGEVIKGDVRCNGSILRFNPDGSDIEVFAWGLRNPYGIAFDSSGTLWATNHGADVRGSRNIFNDPDYLFKVEKDAWYGWPDFFDSEPVTNSRFKETTKPQPNFIWQDHPKLSEPFLTFDSHAGINGLALSPGGSFGFQDEVFIAMFGTYAPIATGVNINPAGFKIVKVNTRTKETFDFAVNKVPGPAYLTLQGGLNRPSDVLFGPDQSLYIVDWGAATLTERGLELVPGSGIIWRIYSKDQNALYKNGPVEVKLKSFAKDPKKPLIPNILETYKLISSQIFILVGISISILGILVLIWILLRRK
jgi:glucose/arabinose dehydrogenase